MKFISILLFLVFYSFMNVYAKPPYDGTIWFFPDVIKSKDPTTFQELIYVGQDNREMFDRRKGGRWVTKKAFLFNAIYEDTTVEIQVNPEFKNVDKDFEIQDKVITEKIVQEESIVLTSKESKYMYFTPTYNHFGKWTLSLFSDYEKNDKTIYGADYTFNYNNSQISFFLGSQKGGLVCANGSCIMQPDFTNGFKVTYRTTL